MKKVTKPEDQAAALIEFGVEIETFIPETCGVDVGSYHSGRSVVRGIKPNGDIIEAPQFDGNRWRADRDGSIVYGPTYKPCEFVSPVLHGSEGINALREIVKFIRQIGGDVNNSCGLHVTVGIKSIIGSAEPEKIAEFVRKLAHIAQHQIWAIYAQTGTGRHTNHYAHQLRPETESYVDEMTKTTDRIRLCSLANQCGRGAINFQKAFCEKPAIEFRAFAGTINEQKVLHHVATALGVMRRAATVQTFGRFDRKSTKKHANVQTAVDALKRMWRILGWVDSVPGRDCALGLFGPLHAEFGKYRKAALEMAEKFEQRYPHANL